MNCHNSKRRARCETAKRAQIEVDLGGREALSELTRDLVNRYIVFEGIWQFQAEDTLKHGAKTLRGRISAGFQALLQTTDRLIKIGQLLGLERRERQVDSMADYLDRLAHEAARTRQDGSGEAIDVAHDREVLHPADPATVAADGLTE